jgi:protocatechuate 3,4-dioxygenase beta subunit
MTDQRDATGQSEVDGNAAGASRRTVMKAGLVGAAAMALTATGVAAASSATAKTTVDGKLVLTASCTDGDETPSLTEGPYFKANSPLRTNLVTSGITGVLLSLSGTVYDVDCNPVPNAKLDFWQCDRNGVYDNSTYTLRGHQFSTATGRYTLETVVPGYYPGRTIHIHLKVQAPRATILTSQLFFPDNTQAYGLNFANLNRRDRIINRDCTIALGTLSNNRYAGTFDFVVDTV